MRFARLRHPLLTHRRTKVLPRWVRRSDHAINRWMNGRSDSRGRDGLLKRLSRAANYSRLWFGTAALLVLARRPRAAARGVVSLVVASAIANLIGKRIFGGSRPIWKHTPVGRRLHAYPTSASFPSGHSASAAAFATGVALESRGGGALVAPVAGAVAYSRMHSGAHWASDVAAGVAIGAGVAVLGAALVRSEHAADTSVAHTGDRVELPVSEDGKGVLIVLNERAGASVLRADPRALFARRLPAAKVAEMGSGVTLDDIVRRAVSGDDPPRVLAIYGGDGSVARAAHLAREFSLPLLVLPGGTFNHFARAAGVHTPDEGIDALQQGAGLRVAAAALTARGEPDVTVMNTASVGIYPDFVAERERHESRWGKWVAGVIAAAAVLRQAEPIEVEVDGEPMRVWSLFASVGRNDAGRVSTMQRRTLADEVLDVRILHARGSRLRAFGSIAFGQRTEAVLRLLRLLPKATDVERRLVRELELGVRADGDRVVPYAHDGEVEESPPLEGEKYVLTLAVRAGALEVYSPDE